MSFIEELFYGNLDPQSRPRRSTCRVSRAVASLDGLEDTLTERLQGEDKRLFARLVSRLVNLTARFVRLISAQCRNFRCFLLQILTHWNLLLQTGTSLCN